jgi:hypothetical protein
VSGADTANSPVGYGAIMIIMVGALMLWHFTFVGVAVKFAWTGNRLTWGGKTAMIDVFLLNILPVCVFFGAVLFGLGTGLYVLQQRAWVQYYPNAVSNFGIFVPQDVMYITLWGMSCFQMVFLFKTAFGSAYAQSEADQIKKLDLAPPALPFHKGVSFCTTLVAAAFYLFLGWYPFQLWYSGVGLLPTVCLDNTCTTICPAAGCYDADPYGPLLPFVGTTGLLLAVDVLYTVFREMGPSKALEYKSSLFFIGEGADLQVPMIAAFVPYFQLSYANILANFFFVPVVIALLTHDVVKGVVAAILFSLMPMGFALAAQNSGAYYAFQMAAFFHAIPLFYVASAWLQPACQTPVVGGPRCGLLAPERLANFIEFGTMLTGPDSNANVLADIRTLQMFTYVAFGLIAARVGYWTIDSRRSATVGDVKMG